MCVFAYRTITFFGSTFQWIQLTQSCLPASLGGCAFMSRNPLMTKAQARPHHPRSNLRPTRYVRLIIRVLTPPVSLAATQGMMRTSCPDGSPRDHTGQEVRVSFFLFLWVLRCFTSPGALPLPMYSEVGSPFMTTTGFPHSEILGSTVACHLPEAYRRLLRPSSALCCLAIHRTPFCASAIRVTDRVYVTDPFQRPTPHNAYNIMRTFFDRLRRNCFASVVIAQRAFPSCDGRAFMPCAYHVQISSIVEDQPELS